MNRAHPRRLVRGRCLVCLAALARQGAARGAALFLGGALYVQEEARGPARAFATKPALAADLFARLPAVEGAGVVAVADGAHARQGFATPPSSFSVPTRA